MQSAEWDQAHQALGDTAVESGRNAGLASWRASVLDYVVWVGVAISLVPLASLFLAGPPFIPMKFRLESLGVFLGLLALALFRWLPHFVRTWGLLLIGYAIAAVMFDATGLHGGGRLFLLALPLYAVVLLGSRSGWAAAGLSVFIYILMATLDADGRLASNVTPINSSLPRFWYLQGTVLIMVLVPVMVLLARFIGLLQKTLATERRSVERLMEAAAERRQLERMILELGERERRSVGHQLHDGPCQQITAALLRCKVAENALSARVSHEDVAHLRAIEKMLDASVGEIHDLARGLSPPELASDALVPAIGEMVQRIGASCPAACEFVHERGAVPAAPAASTQLYRIAQEALSNAVRHARARHIRVHLGCRDGMLELDVIDDGVGMGPRQGDEGMGLRIMRYRADVINGNLEVTPAHSGGTRVSCSVPLGQPLNHGEAAP